MTQENGSDQSQDDSRIELQQQPEPAHKCSICGSPDHRACGCEARGKTQTEKPFFGSEQKEEKPLADVLSGDIISARLIHLLNIIGENTAKILEVTDNKLSDIYVKLDELYKLEKDRTDLIRDISNGNKN